jgi:hypothetical protein
MSTPVPFGVPPITASLPFTTGTYFFVCSATGSDGNSGRKPERAFATVQKAIDSCTADKMDVIVLMPGHAETVTATNIALNKAGVQVVGVGSGLKRPTFTYGAAAATITVSAANCSWSGCHFKANFLSVAAAFTLTTAKDFKLEKNTFIDNSSVLDFLSIVVTNATDNAADGLQVLGNWYLSLPTTDAAFISILANLDRLIVADNYVNKAATNNAAHFITLSSKVVTGAQILRNILIVVGATNATVGIFLTGSGTTSNGVVGLNFVASLDTTSALIATAGTGLQFFENYLTGDADSSGALWPVVDNPA